uniref:Cystatin-9-like n=1 Tax=Ictidomys tridecemlineatus TaxID=43179 RepID=I3MPY5_ICTTR
MPCPSGRRALPWTMKLFLFGLLLLVTPLSRAIIEYTRNTDNNFPATVEFAVHSFNQESKDEYAYRLVRVLKSWKNKPADIRAKPNYKIVMAFSMKLKLRRTKCGKLEDDIENCPFQDSLKLNNTFVCFFTISTKPWKTEFVLLNQTCSEELP